jgi:rod shape-determining protein MreC
VVLVVLVVAALALIAFDYRDGSSPALRDLKHAGASVFGGAEHATSAVGRFFDGSASSSQVTQLQKQIVKMRAELSQARLSKSEYKQLRKLLLVAGAGRYRIVPTTVIATGQGLQQTVTLDAGSGSGVRVGQTVLNGEGLVGEVTSVTSSTSTVRLAEDSASVVGVAVTPKGQLGVVTGPGKTAGDAGAMHLQMLNSNDVIRVGEQLVTAASRPYVPGVPVGVITKLLNRAGSLTAVALVRPYVDFGALGVVGIVIARPARNPRFSVLPPLPHPGPTVTVTVTAPPSKKGSKPSPSSSSRG